MLPNLIKHCGDLLGAHALGGDAQVVIDHQRRISPTSRFSPKFNPAVIVQQCTAPKTWLAPGRRPGATAKQD
jgi:hypothetical protein